MGSLVFAFAGVIGIILITLIIFVISGIEENPNIWVPYKYENFKESSGSEWILKHRLFLINLKNSKTKIEERTGHLKPEEFIFKAVFDFGSSR